MKRVEGAVELELEELSVDYFAAGWKIPKQLRAFLQESSHPQTLAIQSGCWPSDLEFPHLTTWQPKMEESSSRPEVPLAWSPSNHTGP